jgi:hypothetical protein
MRLVIFGLVAFASLASLAQAQPTESPASPTPPPAAPQAPAAAPPATPPAATAPAAATPPQSNADAAAALAAALATANAAGPAPAPPAAPPPPPTDPAAIALLNTLQNVCIPSANGGSLAQAAKAAGYRKSGDNFVYKQPTFQFTVLAPGANPTQCHVDMVHPIYPEGPARPMVVALYNWAALTHGWTPYRDDRNVQDGQEFTTRSWEHTADGKSEALVIITMRKADGTPSQRSADTSSMIYSVTKTPG